MSASTNRAAQPQRVPRDAIAEEILRAAFAVPEQVQVVAVTHRGECVRDFAGDLSALPEYPRGNNPKESETVQTFANTQ